MRLFKVLRSNWVFDYCKSHPTFRAILIGLVTGLVLLISGWPIPSAKQGFPDVFIRPTSHSVQSVRSWEKLIQNTALAYPPYYTHFPPYWKVASSQILILKPSIYFSTGTDITADALINASSRIPRQQWRSFFSEWRQNRATSRWEWRSVIDIWPQVRVLILCSVALFLGLMPRSYLERGFFLWISLISVLILFLNAFWPISKWGISECLLGLLFGGGSSYIGRGFLKNVRRWVSILIAVLIGLLTIKLAIVYPLWGLNSLFLSVFGLGVGLLLKGAPLRGFIIPATGSLLPGVFALMGKRINKGLGLGVILLCLYPILHVVFRSRLFSLLDYWTYTIINALFSSNLISDHMFPFFDLYSLQIGRMSLYALFIAGVFFILGFQREVSTRQLYRKPVLLICGIVFLIVFGVVRQISHSVSQWQLVPIVVEGGIEIVVRMIGIWLSILTGYWLVYSKNPFSSSAVVYGVVLYFLSIISSVLLIQYL